MAVRRSGRHGRRASSVGRWMARSVAMDLEASEVQVTISCATSKRRVEMEKTQESIHMCIYVYIYMCIHICISIYNCVHIYIYIYAYVKLYICLCMQYGCVSDVSCKWEAGTTSKRLVAQRPIRGCPLPGYLG